VKNLQELARSARVTVICSIHQPSSQIYHLFDRLAFLNDGKCVYAGPGGEGSVAAFAAAGMECPTHFNPPDFFMELAVAGRFDDAETRRRVTEAVPVDESDGAVFENHATEPIRLREPTSSRYAAPYTTQLYILTMRAWYKARGQKFNFDSWLLYGSLAVITGLCWLGLGDDETDIVLRNGLALWVVGTWMFFPLIASLSVLSPERPLVLTELAVGAYRLSAYYTATAGMILPIDFLFASYYTAIVYLMAFPFYLYFEQLLCFALLNCLTVTMFYSIGLLMATGVPTRHLMVTMLSFITFCFAYAGFFRPYDEMFVWMRWVEHINPFVYTYNVAMHITYSWGPTGFKCFANESAYDDQCADGVISRNEVLKVHGVDKSAGFCVGVMLAITVFCHIVAYQLMRRDYARKVHALDEESGDGAEKAGGGEGGTVVPTSKALEAHVEVNNGNGKSELISDFKITMAPPLDLDPTERPSIVRLSAI